MEDQRLAYSNDRGRTWTHYSGNPVLDIGLPDFRDPKVFWHEQTKRWIMVVVVPDGEKDRPLRFRGPQTAGRHSANSVRQALGRIQLFGSVPDLFSLEVEGEPEVRKWVLIVNINPGGPAGGSGTQYFVGEFDGIAVHLRSGPFQRSRRLARPWQRFLRRRHVVKRSRVRWTAHSPRVDEQLGIHARHAHEPMAQRDDYSSVSHAQAHLRWLALGTNADRGDRDPPREPALVFSGGSFTAADLWLYQQSDLNELLDVEMTFSEVFPSAPFVINIHTGTAEVTAIVIDPSERKLIIDRTHSGIKEFHPAFAASSRHAAPLRIANGILKIRFLLDTSSLEIFAQDGEIVLTDLIFPNAGKRSIGLSSEGGNALSMPKVERDHDT